MCILCNSLSMNLRFISNNYWNCFQTTFLLILQMIKMMLAVVGVFIFCWLPFNLFMVRKPPLLTHKLLTIQSTHLWLCVNSLIIKITLFGGQCCFLSRLFYIRVRDITDYCFFVSFNKGAALNTVVHIFYVLNGDFHLFFSLLVHSSLALPSHQMRFYLTSGEFAIKNLSEVLIYSHVSFKLFPLRFAFHWLAMSHSELLQNMFTKKNLRNACPKYLAPWQSCS